MAPGRAGPLVVTSEADRRSGKLGRERYEDGKACAGSVGQEGPRDVLPGQRRGGGAGFVVMASGFEVKNEAQTHKKWSNSGEGKSHEKSSSYLSVRNEGDGGVRPRKKGSAHPEQSHETDKTKQH